MEDYKNFDEELLEYAKNIPYVSNVQNPFDEWNYGDSQQLVVKYLLQYYKKMHPNMSYKEIYEQYLKKINESTILTQKEKRQWYALRKGQLEVEEDQQTKNENKIQLIAVVGGEILFAGVVVMLMIKRRKVTI